jgi:predicted transcriptional regulator
MLTSTELKIFEILQRPKSLSQIAEQLDLSVPAISKCINISIKNNNGLFERRRSGKKVLIQRADTNHAHILGNIFTGFKRQPIVDLLSHNSLRILSVILEREKSAREISHIVQVTREHTHKCLTTLARHGIVNKNNLKYKMNPRNKSILEFVRSYYSYKNLSTARTSADDAVILWERGYEFLFRTSKKIKKINIRSTAISRFPEFGLPLLTNINYYFHTKRKMELGDIIIHTVLIDPQSPIYNGYACLLCLKTNTRDLLKIAKIYDMVEHIDIILKYLETRERDVPWLLSWSEFEELAKDYGVVP